MNKLTLRDYQEKSIDDLYMALIVETNILNNIISLSSFRVYKMIKQGNLPASFAKELTKRDLFYVHEEYVATIILVVGINYINVCTGAQIDMSKCKLSYVEPFSSYYSEGDYSFVEENGIITIQLNSSKPFDEYQSKVLF